MPDTFQLVCPECGLQYQLETAMEGAKVKCTECGVKFIAHDESIAAPQREPEPAFKRSEPEDAGSEFSTHVVKPTAKASPPPDLKPDTPPAEKTAPPAQPDPEPSAREGSPREHGEDNSPKIQTQPKSTSVPKESTSQKVAPPKAEPAATKAAPQPQPTQKPQPAHTPHADAKHFAAVENIAKAHQQILAEVGKVIIGQRDVIDQVLTAFFARGNCLLKGVPGLAKTLLVNTFADAMALQFHRIQFTPDLMPSDITGTNILEEDPVTGKRIFTFRKGPVFTNLLLADEINRTPPKTQAALLEAMQERQVTSGEKLYSLPNPFLVLATQNPIEQEGTYTLPEAQLDRFIFMVNVDYPSEKEELEILLETTRDKGAKVEHVLDAAAIIRIQEVVRSIPVTEHVAGYAARLVRATRPEDPTAPDFIKNWLHFGCGPRAGQSLLLAAKAHAALNGRIAVACDDIRAYALPTLRHRLVLNFAAAAEGLSPDDIIKKLLETIKERPA